MTLDEQIKAARAEGYSDDEILEHVGKGDPQISSALAEGHTADEILHYLATGKAYQSTGGAANAVPVGANSALATIAGAPVDAMNWLMGSPAERPIGGSGSIKDALNWLGRASGSEHMMAYEDIKDLPPSERPFAVAGENLGGAIPFAAAPMMAAQGTRLIEPTKNLLAPVLRLAQESPRNFALTEGVLAGSAAYGGAAAQVLAPDNPLARFGAEVVATVTSPAMLAAKATGSLYRGGRSLVQSMTGGGLERQAGAEMNKWVRNLGEDPADVIAGLRQSVPGAPLMTAGQKTGSPAVLAMESMLAEKSPSFMGTRTQRAKSARATLWSEAEALAQSGDPKALTEAATKKKQYFDSLMANRLEAAQQRSAEAWAQATGSETKADMANASSNARNVLWDAYDDVQNTRGELANILSPEELTSFDEAAQKAFGRFAGEALASNADGLPRIRPELLLEQGFGSGGNVAAMRFEELANAAKFADQRASFEGYGPAMEGEQERFLKIAAKAAQGADGSVNPDQLNRFLTQNELVLQRFPQLREALGSAESAERAFQDVGRLTATAQKTLAREAAFSKLLDNADPARVLSDVLKGKQPVKQFDELTRIARASGPGATAGLRTATIDSALNRATSKNGVSFQALSDSMRVPLSRGQPSALDLLRTRGVMDEGTAGRLEKILDAGLKVERSAEQGARLDDMAGDMDGLFDLLVRLGGAKLGTAISGMSGTPAAGHGLIAAQRGSAYLRNLFERVPVAKLRNVLIKAAEDPEFMALLLEKHPGRGGDPARWRQLASAWMGGEGMDQSRINRLLAIQEPSKQMNAFILNAGLQGAMPPEEPVDSPWATTATSNYIDVPRDGQMFRLPLDGRNPDAVIQGFLRGEIAPLAIFDEEQ